MRACVRACVRNSGCLRTFVYFSENNVWSRMYELRSCHALLLDYQNRLKVSCPHFISCFFTIFASQTMLNFRCLYEVFALNVFFLFSFSRNLGCLRVKETKIQKKCRSFGSFSSLLIANECFILLNPSAVFIVWQSVTAVKHFHTGEKSLFIGSQNSIRGVITELLMESRKARELKRLVDKPTEIVTRFL